MIHLYAITDGTVDTGQLPAGVGHARVRAIAEGVLTALVSEHGAAPHGSARDAWEHEAVVEAAMAAATVLPASLGTVLGGEDEVRALLRGRHDEFASDLRRLAGCVEVGVHGAAADLPERLRPCVSAWTSQRGSLACLVHEQTLERLLAEVAELETAEGVHLVVTGPWPPYTFVTQPGGLLT
jgi:hypothetical protein